MSDDSLVLSTEEQKGKDDFDLGHTETLEQKFKKAYYGRSGWVLGSPIPQYVDTEHEYDGLYVESNWSLEEVDEEEKLMDAEDLEAEEQEQEQELNAFYGRSDSVSLGQLTLKAKELAYIRGEGLPIHMGCGLFGSNIIFLGGIESRFDCHGDDFITYPRKDIYVFDTKHPYTYQVFNNSSLEQGKSSPLLVHYYDKLHVLSILILRASLGPVLCFNMVDPSPKWREHNFTNCSELPWECMGETLTIEYGDEDGDEDLVILSCRPHLDVVDGYNDPPHYRHYEWKITFITAHLMSKDYTLLTPFERGLRIPHGYLPSGDKHLPVHGVEYKLVYLQGREICLIISVDRGDEFEDGKMERMQTYVMIFEFEIIEGKHTLAFKILHPPSMIIDDRSSESRTNKVGLEGAFFL
ncbi:unnamed protein product [Prunus brigantina]